MKTILTILLFLTTYAHAGKTYNVSIQVFSAGTLEPLAGIIILDDVDKELVEIGRTNEQGEFLYTGLKDKYFSCRVNDPNGTYQSKYFSESNSDKQDITVQIHMEWTGKTARQIFAERDAKYPLDNGLVIIQEGNTLAAEQEIESENIVVAKYGNSAGDLSKFIFSKINFPQECIEKNIQGKVYVSFFVEKDGTVTHLEVEKGVHPLLDREAIRVMRNMHKWQAGTVDDEPTRTRVIMVVPFILN
ncbi:MAG: energy transducer TonB [Bacteroidota bacterium]